jgi:hypothetical protein
MYNTEKWFNRTESRTHVVKHSKTVVKDSVSSQGVSIFFFCVRASVLTKTEGVSALCCVHARDVQRLRSVTQMDRYLLYRKSEPMQ